ncbi:MAG: ATPase domain-containing protein, partial [Deltaproteobacteria bacterium]
MPAKVTTAFVCQSCGNQFPKWIGRCPSCQGWNTLVEERVVAPPKGRGAPRAPREPIALNEVPPDAEARISTGIGEFDRVLGGGVVRGSLVLLGGDPGIGKSSLLMQASASLAERGTVLYVSGEESAAQIKMRARRFGIESPNILVLAETDLGTVIEAIRRTRPIFTVIDSIQTMSSEVIGSAAGGVSQLRECAARLLEVAKGDDVPIFLVGHVTKEGAVAGPRVLEHIVDAVLYLEG